MKINYKKTSKTIYLKDTKIIVKNNTIYFNENIMNKKIGHIFISGDSTISAKALKLLHEMRVCIHLNYKNAPIYNLTPRTFSYLKRKQAELIGNNKEFRRCIKRILTLRSLISKKNNLPCIIGFIDHKNLLISEARYMKHVYAITSRRSGLKWSNKEEIGQNTALHFWWNQLYSAIETCLAKMGTDRDLGFFHNCERGFVYDIADIIKPFFLEKALTCESNDVKTFWEIYKENKLNKLIPMIISYVILGNEHESYSLLRLHLDRAFPRKKSRSNS